MGWRQQCLDVCGAICWTSAKSRRRHSDSPISRRTFLSEASLDYRSRITELRHALLGWLVQCVVALGTTRRAFSGGSRIGIHRENAPFYVWAWPSCASARRYRALAFLLRAPIGIRRKMQLVHLGVALMCECPQGQNSGVFACHYG